MARVRQKNCDRCGETASVLYRVQIDAAGGWLFVCDRCWSEVSPNNPDYVYGGTWKARKKR
ncbi:hypothetical protein [Sphaerothrix gracilis]|uniref:hypothetical protein n=1 Tax=Sphaerothrix gracilis TaxID=3151835 RepID=UPI0031FCE8D5